MNWVVILFILSLLVIIAGGIEHNPGPEQCKNHKLCHVNIRRLSRSNSLAIKTMLAEIDDIITVSETHFQAGIPNNQFDLEGYHGILKGIGA